MNAYDIANKVGRLVDVAYHTGAACFGVFALMNVDLAIRYKDAHFYTIAGASIGSSILMEAVKSFENKFRGNRRNLESQLNLPKTAQN